MPGAQIAADVWRKINSMKVADWLKMVEQISGGVGTAVQVVAGVNEFARYIDQMEHIAGQYFDLSGDQQAMEMKRYLNTINGAGGLGNFMSDLSTGSLKVRSSGWGSGHVESEIPLLVDGLPFLAGQDPLMNILMANVAQFTMNMRGPEGQPIFQYMNSRAGREGMATNFFQDQRGMAQNGYDNFSVLTNSFQKFLELQLAMDPTASVSMVLHNIDFSDLMGGALQSLVTQAQGYIRTLTGSGEAFMTNEQRQLVRTMTQMVQYLQSEDTVHYLENIGFTVDELKDNFLYHMQAYTERTGEHLTDQQVLEAFREATAPGAVINAHPEAFQAMFPNVVTEYNQHQQADPTDTGDADHDPVEPDPIMEEPTPDVGDDQPAPEEQPPAPAYSDSNQLDEAMNVGLSAMQNQGQDVFARNVMAQSWPDSVKRAILGGATFDVHNNATSAEDNLIYPNNSVNDVQFQDGPAVAPIN